MRWSQPYSIPMPRRPWLPTFGGAWSSTPPEIVGAMFASFAGYDTAASARQLRVPVRCKPDLFPTDTQAIRKSIADFDAVVLPHTGHFPMLERPDEFNRKLAETLAAIQATWALLILPDAQWHKAPPGSALCIRAKLGLLWWGRLQQGPLPEGRLNSGETRRHFRDVRLL
jgi:hypothetical protein